MKEDLRCTLIFMLIKAREAALYTVIPRIILTK